MTSTNKTGTPGGSARSPSSPGKAAFESLKTTFARAEPIKHTTPPRAVAPAKPAARPTPAQPQASGLDGALSDALAAFGLSEVPQQSPTPAAPPPPAPKPAVSAPVRARAFRPPAPVAELMPLFSAAHTELASLPSTRIVELSAYDLTTATPGDDITVLWTMARQSIDDPTLNFVSDVSESHLRSVSSPQLDRAIQIAAKTFDKQKRIQAVAKLNGVTSASWRSRRRAATYDLIVALAICAPLSIITTAWFSATVNLDIISLSSLTPVDAVEIITSYVVLLLISSILIPMVSTIMFRQSLGMRLTGLILTKPDGTLPDLIELTYRACLTPLTILGAPFDCFADRLPVHDRHLALLLRPIEG